MSLRTVIILVVLMMVFTGVTIGNVLYKDDLENGTIMGAGYHTNFSWSDDDCTLNDSRIDITLCKGANFAGYAMMEGMKYFVKVGYENPEYNAQFGLDLALLAIQFLIMNFLFMPLLFTGCLIYLLFDYLRNKYWRKK